MKKSITGTFFLLTVWAFNLHAQTSLYVYSSGKNRLLFINPHPGSVAVQAQGFPETFIPALGFSEMKFPLTRAYVEKRLFRTSYNQTCFLYDSLLCRQQSLPVNTIAANQAEVKRLARMLVQDQLQPVAFAGLLTGMAPLTGLSQQEVDTLKNRLLEVYHKKGVKEVMIQQVDGLLNTAFMRSNHTIPGNNACVENARQRLHTIAPDSFYAAAFLTPKERLSLELTMLGVAGFKISKFRQGGGRRAYQTVLYGIQPAYGARLTCRFNAYDAYKIRNSGVQAIVPISVFNSGAVYKKTPDSIFEKNQTRQWLMMSIGYGQEFTMYKPGRQTPQWALVADFGVVTGVVTTGALNSDAGRIQNRRREPGFAGIVPYFNIGYKRRLTNWLDFYASYFSTFMYSYMVYDVRDMPRFRQFNLGLNIVFYRKVNYQY